MKCTGPCDVLTRDDRSLPYNQRLGALKKTSWVTILVRLAACALIGIGIFLFLAGLFLSHGTATMCVAAMLVIGFAVVLLRMNPRKPISATAANPNADGHGT